MLIVLVRRRPSLKTYSNFALLTTTLFLRKNQFMGRKAVVSVPVFLNLKPHPPPPKKIYLKIPLSPPLLPLQSSKKKHC